MAKKIIYPDWFIELTKEVGTFEYHDKRKTGRSFKWMYLKPFIGSESRLYHSTFDDVFLLSKAEIDRRKGLFKSSLARRFPNVPDDVKFRIVPSKRLSYYGVYYYDWVVRMLVPFSYFEGKVKT